MRALGPPRLRRCAKDPLGGAAAPRSRALPLAPPKPRTPAYRSPGRGGAAHSDAASGFIQQPGWPRGGGGKLAEGGHGLGGGGRGARGLRWAEGRQC